MTERGLRVDEAGLEAMAGALARVLEPGTVLFLQGDLGAGKTTFVRALLRALGWQQAVKSPTYTIVESYPLAQFTLHHFDCYRLADPQELQLLGIRDYFDGDSVVAVEWPDKGAGYLSTPDLVVALEGSGASRQLQWQACSKRGERLQKAFDCAGKAR
ncbi:MAG: tRNA (adenosine(37)-N6)-threonylcarbamoyltransferase complex ATPase subunit type 1 TsaE [Gammaproteobacteria bacterium]|nr:MAG: tRNA (adenosine(37)-N6)-threonylcarbamoyltransferase complex ATPase subunit type 1 TsaE [Gammaproteobacteria bacterium]